MYIYIYIYIYPSLPKDVIVSQKVNQKSTKLRGSYSGFLKTITNNQFKISYSVGFY